MKYIEFKEKYGLQLNEQQEAAVLKTDGAVLLLAVPGSGKTTTLVARIGYLIYCRGVPPEKILTMTYTVAATADMKSRFISFFGDEYADRLSFRTINGICATIINRYVALTGADPFELSEDNAPLIKELFRKVYNAFPDENDVKESQSAITYIKNMRLAAEEIESVKIAERAAAPLYNEYCGAMKRLRRMDYDDQMVIARTILLKYPEILRQFYSRFEYICVDEAQDTSKIQHEIIRIMTRTGGNIFMVGDEDQSIYSFRAAYPDALMEFDDTYENSSIMYLEQNFRSTPEIVTAANRLIANNKNRREKKMFTRIPSGTGIEKREFKKREEQYSYICSLIKGDRNTETAVLYRNNDSAVPLIDRLDREGVTFRCRQTETLFFTNKTVQGMTDFLRFAFEPKNEELFLKIYYKLGLNIKKTSAERAVNEVAAGREDNYFLALIHDESLSENLRLKLLGVSNQFKKIPFESASEAVNRVRYNLGYGGYILRTSRDTERLFLLSALAKREKSAKTFLERLDRLKEITESGGDRKSSLILSTIHSSKGLEYDRVILIDAVEGVLPSLSASVCEHPNDEELKTLEEERRLFYVAITRARKDLRMLSYGDFTESIFLKQAGIGGQKRDFKPCSGQGSSINHSPTANKSMVRKGRGLLKGISTEKSKYTYDDFRAGMDVKHKTFGKGIIISIQDDNIIIDFDHSGRKTLMLSACIKMKLLSPAEE